MSVRAAERLVELGWSDVVEYPGGWREWYRVTGHLVRREERRPEEEPPRPSP